MYIFSSDKKSILDSLFVQRFCIVEKSDAVLVIASYNENRAVTERNERKAGTPPAS